MARRPAEKADQITEQQQHELQTLEELTRETAAKHGELMESSTRTAPQENLMNVAVLAAARASPEAVNAKRDLDIGSKTLFQ